ncbi:MAG: glutamine synthetase III [Firmicutes bacterium]|nr:glutamine synthetase III [Bacillota bacterium]
MNPLFDFGKNVFSDEVLRKRLSSKFFNELMQVKNEGLELSVCLADEVAEAMKTWAMENGATHYTHWFFPLTGATAEKHDAFLNVKNSKAIFSFSGKQLIKGEADASSLPSGGARETFEARGYTVWDLSSPVFLKISKSGMIVLCIPTAFCSYTGEALDKKTPLLRAMDALNTEALKVLKLLDNKTSKKVVFELGPEQEYFLINKSDYLKRTDLKFTGRTLFGAPAPKGQEKDDQYYAIIKERVLGFMNDLNSELWKLGISAKTQHNETAPCQHELAVVYDTANIATDHNQLIMETMRTVADRHNLAILLHEKPFEGISGSGKHCNFSLCTDDNIHILDPGKNPEENIQFLLFFTAVIAAVDEYADLLRMSAGYLGNDLRLGSNEAPPAIISIYIGERLLNVLSQLENSNFPAQKQKEVLKPGGTLPSFSKDFEDRNRTSPFAFTNRRFEFRMTGSSATTATPATVVCVALAEILNRISEQLQNTENKKEACLKIIQKLIKEHKRIIFNGNNYSKEWIEEAKTRGLSNLSNCVEAYKTISVQKNINLLQKHKVLSSSESLARQEIYFATYEKNINIEAKTMHKIAKSEILPAVLKYIGLLAKDIKNISKISSDFTVQKLVVDNITKELNKFYILISKLEKAILGANSKKGCLEKAIAFRDGVIPEMKTLRESADALEVLMPKDLWPMPVYSDILFYE